MLSLLQSAAQNVDAVTRWSSVRRDYFWFLVLQMKAEVISLFGEA